MNESDKITEIEFTFRCRREWENLKPTENPDVRFCDDCRLNVHFVTGKSDFAKYDRSAKCFAVKLYDEDRSKSVTIAGGIDVVPQFKRLPRASFVFKFGAKSNLTQAQLATIQWLRRFATGYSLKEKMVKLFAEEITEDDYDRIVGVLKSENIPFDVE